MKCFFFFFIAEERGGEHWPSCMTEDGVCISDNTDQTTIEWILH